MTFLFSLRMDFVDSLSGRGKPLPYGVNAGAIHFGPPGSPWPGPYGEIRRACIKMARHSELE